MATISKNWSSEGTVYNTTLNSTTEVYSSNVPLEASGYEGAHVEVEISWGSSAEDIAISFYGALDGSDFDDLPFYSMQVTNGDATQLAFVIKDVANFRVGFVHTGTESNNATVTCVYQAWNYTDGS